MQESPDITEFDGHCTCGHVHFRMLSKPMFVHCCHCTWCQRETGTAFALNAMIEAERVELLQGNIEVIHTPSNSGKGQHISRCPHCKIALWSNYAGAGERIRFVRVGTLKRRDLLPPDIHIFTSTKLPWVVLPDGVPAVAEYYKSVEYWPAESLARRAQVLAK
ncbi:MAG: GFA family protein [Burkholderiales bacterium]|nr:GFA family protein [Burkholderiales bacterium]